MKADKISLELAIIEAYAGGAAVVHLPTGVSVLRQQEHLSVVA